MTTPVTTLDPLAVTNQLKSDHPAHSRTIGNGLALMPAARAQLLSAARALYAAEVQDAGRTAQQARQGRLSGVSCGGHVEAADGGRSFGQGLRLSGFDHDGLRQPGRGLGEEKGGDG
jgi:hypothetical protein